MQPNRGGNLIWPYRVVSEIAGVGSQDEVLARIQMFRPVPQNAHVLSRLFARRGDGTAPDLRPENYHICRSPRRGGRRSLAGPERHEPGSAVRLNFNIEFYSPYPLHIVDFMPLLPLYGDLAEDRNYFELVMAAVGLQGGEHSKVARGRFRPCGDFRSDQGRNAQRASGRLGTAAAGRRAPWRRDCNGQIVGQHSLR
jgi:hypothetical protein